MLKTLILSTALVGAGTGLALAQGDKAIQGRPMGGLAISMQDEQALEAASWARPRPSPQQTLMMLKRNMVKNAM